MFLARVNLLSTLLGLILLESSRFTCQTYEPNWVGSNKRDFEHLRSRVERIFYHSYNNYMEHGFPHDELKPLSCSPSDNFGGYMLTLIDALDTLAILGNSTEFTKAVHILSDRLSFDIDATVSVFETNIRVRPRIVRADHQPPLQNSTFPIPQIFKPKLPRILPRAGALAAPPRAEPPARAAAAPRRRSWAGCSPAICSPWTAASCPATRAPSSTRPSTWVRRPPAGPCLSPLGAQRHAPSARAPGAFRKTAARASGQDRRKRRRETAARATGGRSDGRRGLRPRATAGRRA